MSTFLFANTHTNTNTHPTTATAGAGASGGHAVFPKTISMGSGGGAAPRGLMPHSASLGLSLGPVSVSGTGLPSQPPDGVRALFHHFPLPHHPPPSLLLNTLAQSQTGATYDAHSTAVRSDDYSQHSRTPAPDAVVALTKSGTGTGCFSPNGVSGRPTRRRIPSPQQVGGPVVPALARRYPSPPSVSTSNPRLSYPPTTVEFHRLSSEIPAVVYENCPECECAEFETECTSIEGKRPPSPKLPQYPNKTSRTQSPHTQYTKAATLWSLPPPEPFAGSRASTLARNAPGHASLLMLNGGETTYKSFDFLHYFMYKQYKHRFIDRLVVGNSGDKREAGGLSNALWWRERDLEAEPDAGVECAPQQLRDATGAVADGERTRMDSGTAGAAVELYRPNVAIVGRSARLLADQQPQQHQQHHNQQQNQQQQRRLRQALRDETFAGTCV